MKKAMISFGIVAIVVIGVLITLATVDFNRLGKDNAYVQIKAPLSVEETKLDSGEVIKTYWYALPAFSENGEEIEVEFSANKELRQDAYLMLYLKEKKTVTSYDEVKLTEIPEKVKEKFE